MNASKIWFTYKGHLLRIPLPSKIEVNVYETTTRSFLYRRHDLDAVRSRDRRRVPALSGGEIIAQVPGLDEIADFDVIDFGKWPGPHVTPSRMMELARATREKLADESVAGAVVTHGTDTLEETAYLLDLVLNEEKPVVFVGAMRNSSELSWDGPGNLRSAVRVAVDAQARGLGVIVAMNDQLIAAAEATKTHTESTDTFQSRDFGPLGFIDKDRVIVTRRPVHPEGREHIVTDRIEERVDVIKMVAGADGRFINFAIDDGARGLVIEALAAATSQSPLCPRSSAPPRPAFRSSSRRAARAGVCSTLMRTRARAASCERWARSWAECCRAIRRGSN